METLNTVFDKVLLINMDKDEYKLKLCTHVLNGVEFERVPAVVLNKPEWNSKENAIYGNRESHVKAIQTAKDKGCKSALVFEDDILFEPYYQRFLPRIKNFLDNNDWAVFYLGGYYRFSIYEKTEYKNIVKLGEMVGTHSVAYNSKYYDKLLDWFKKKENLLTPIDYLLAGFPDKRDDGFCWYNPTYSVFPRICYQLPNTNKTGKYYGFEYWRDANEEYNA